MLDIRNACQVIVGGALRGIGCPRCVHQGSRAGLRRLGGADPPAMRLLCGPLLSMDGRRLIPSAEFQLLLSDGQLCWSERDLVGTVGSEDQLAMRRVFICSVQSGGKAIAGAGSCLLSPEDVDQ
jgi:hypothetical protein